MIFDAYCMWVLCYRALELHVYSFFTVVLGNAFIIPFVGLPNALGGYDETPEIMSSLLKVRVYVYAMYVIKITLLYWNFRP